MLALGLALLVAGCTGHQAGSNEPALREVFKGVRVDPVRGLIEIDGRVATDVHDQDTPDVYLEVIVCTRDTREHESLVVIDAAAAQVHAALLLIGLEPGHPGGWKDEGGRLVPIKPQGDPVRVTLAYTLDGKACESPCEAWITVGPGRQDPGPLEFVFAGSGFRVYDGVERYLADLEGTVVGLTTFGTELIAPTSMHHPDSRVETPTLMARSDVIPAFGEPVTVRIHAIRDKSAP